MKSFSRKGIVAERSRSLLHSTGSVTLLPFFFLLPLTLFPSLPAVELQAAIYKPKVYGFHFLSKTGHRTKISIVLPAFEIKKKSTFYIFQAVPSSCESISRYVDSDWDFKM